MRTHLDSIDRQSLAELSPGDRIDEICDHFEFKWRDYPRPDFFRFLQLCDSGERSALFTELILVDRELRKRANEELTWDEYLSVYPDFAPQIEAVRFRELQTAKPACTIGIAAVEQKRIAHFDLLQRIGSGASGNVWRAFDERLRRNVAVKISNGSDLSERDVGRFLREAQTISRLRHPGIVSVFQVDRTDDVVFIVSDLISGTDLSKQLSISRPDFKQAANWTGQIARALHYAHCQGVIHRDIKPANVIIDYQGRATITDFGLAKQIKCRSSLSLPNHIIGTPAYMSPEQARGHGHHADARSDIYSLGVVLYEMLAGRVPFEGEIDSVLLSVLTKEPSRPRHFEPKIPGDLELICCKCIEKRPERRYETALEVAEDIDRFMKGEPIDARHFRAASLALRKLRRPRFVAIAIAACIFLFAINRPKSPSATAVVQPVRVKLDTLPAGSNVAFVPLGDNGEPIQSKVIRPPSSSPVELSVMPGDYLVEVLDSDGRFNEVLRRVPNGQLRLGFTQDHYRWTTTKDGRVELPRVQIPEVDIQHGMVLVDGATEDEEQIPPFYIDRLPLTVGDYLRVIPSLPNYLDPNLKPEQPILLEYHDAVQYAERAGKRLPTVAEWRNAERCLPPRLPTDLAEWTATWHRSPTLKEPEGYTETHQVVCGNVAANKSSLNPSDPTLGAYRWAIASRNQRNPGIGLRCVRDVNPRFIKRDATQSDSPVPSL